MLVYQRVSPITEPAQQVPGGTCGGFDGFIGQDCGGDGGLPATAGGEGWSFMDLKNPKKYVLKTIQPPCFCLENVSYKTIN